MKNEKHTNKFHKGQAIFFVCLFPTECEAQTVSFHLHIPQKEKGTEDPNLGFAEGR